MYNPLPFQVDVYERTTTYNDANQPVHAWTKNRTIKCDYMPSRAEERLVGRVQNPISFLIWTDDLGVDNNNQLRDLRDRYDEVVDEGPFNVIGIKKTRGWAQVTHVSINLQKVLE